MAGDMLGDGLSMRARRRARFASSARMSRATIGRPAADEAVLLLRLHALELVAALAERAELRAGGSLARSGSGWRSAPRRASMRASTRSVFGRLSERAKCQACSGFSRTKSRPAASRTARTAWSQPLVASNTTKSSGPRPGGPAGDRLRLVDDPRLAAAGVEDVDRILREIDADVVPCHAAVLSMSPGSRAHATVQAGQSAGGGPFRIAGFREAQAAGGFTTGTPSCHESQTGRAVGEQRRQDGNSPAMEPCNTMSTVAALTSVPQPKDRAATRRAAGLGRGGHAGRLSSPHP